MKNLKQTDYTGKIIKDAFNELYHIIIEDKNNSNFLNQNELKNISYNKKLQIINYFKKYFNRTLHAHSIDPLIENMYKNSNDKWKLFNYLCDLMNNIYFFINNFFYEIDNNFIKLKNTMNLLQINLNKTTCFEALSEDIVYFFKY